MKEKPKVKRVNENTRNGNILKKTETLNKKNKKSDKKISQISKNFLVDIFRTCKKGKNLGVSRSLRLQQLDHF